MAENLTAETRRMLRASAEAQIEAGHNWTLPAPQVIAVLDALDAAERRAEAMRAELMIFGFRREVEGYLRCQACGAQVLTSDPLNAAHHCDPCRLVTALEAQ